MATTVKLNGNQRAVLRILASGAVYDEDFACFPFAPIAKRTGLPKSEVRLACRALKRKGLAEFHAGLWTEDGDMAGAGYCATKAGRALIGDDLPAREYVD